MLKRVIKMYKKQGFTLIELLTTLAIVGVLGALAGPSFTTWIQNNRIQSVTDRMVATLNYARSEAVRTGVAVNIARSSSTQKDLGSEGWQIYTDAGSRTLGNTAFNSNDGDVLLRRFEGYGNADVTVRTNDTGNNWIAYSTNGALAESGQTVQIAICDARGESFGRLVTVSNTGRATVTIGSSATPLATCSP